VEESLAGLFTMLEKALNRCIHFTAGAQAYTFVTIVNVSGNFLQIFTSPISHSPPFFFPTLTQEILGTHFPTNHFL
jgi:hypothetical protein